MNRNLSGRDVLNRATEPLRSADPSAWLRTGLATTGAFVAVSVASAITSAYRRRREGG